MSNPSVSCLEVTSVHYTQELIHFYTVTGINYIYDLRNQCIGNSH